MPEAVMTIHVHNPTERRLCALVEKSAVAIWLLDAKGTILYSSPAVTRILGYDFTAQVGGNIFEWIHPEDRGHAAELLARLLQEPACTINGQLRHRDKDNSWRWLEVTGTNLLSEPEVEAIVINYVDMTEQKHTEERYRSIAENIQDGLAIIMDKETIYVNNRLSEILGYPKEDLVNMTSFDLAAPEEKERLKEIAEDVRQGNIPPKELQFWVVCKNGERRFIQNRYAPLWDGISRLVVTTDITELELAEIERARYAGQLQELAEAALEVNSLFCARDVLKALSEKARSIIGTHLATASLTKDESCAQLIQHTSLSSKYASWQGYDERPDGSGIYKLVCLSNMPMRLTQAELEAHPAWRGFSKAAGKHPPLRGWLAVPFTGRDGRNLGIFQLSDKYEGEFSKNDEAVLVQLAQIGSGALENARLYEQAKFRHDQLRRLSRQVISAQEEERRSISRELHDEMGQLMTALKVSLELIQDDLPLEPSVLHHHLLEARTLVNETMGRIHTLAQGLRPPALDAIGLNPTLEGLCRDFARRTHLVIDYSGSELPPLPDAANITLYRTVQEALTNVAKHAQASRVGVSLTLGSGQITLLVEDDGLGFDPQATAGIKSLHGFGLMGMKERLELLNGRLQIESSPGRGTRLIARIPYSQPAHSACAP
jgi:PAS domain S-box-containing protein